MTTPPFQQYGRRSEISGDDTDERKLSAHELGVADKARPAEYTQVPATAYHLFPPSGRLLLALLFARRVFGEDELGGWVKLGQGLTSRFDLTNKDVRHRAVASLEKQGTVEVRRRRGRCAMLRLATE